MSRKIFFIIAPIYLLLAGILCYFFVPETPQYVPWLFALAYYLLVLYSQRKFGASPSQTTNIKPEPLAGKISAELRDITLHEYDYVRETMAQAMNDRHTLVNYFLLATGVAMAAIGAVFGKEGIEDSPYKVHLAVAILLIFCLVSWIYFLKIVRLRQAWCESCVAMNRIKQFFLVNERHGVPAAQSPFWWRSDTIPPPAKKGNLFHLEALLIQFISALALSAVSVLLLPSQKLACYFWAPVLCFGFMFFLQLSAYTVFLEEKPAVNTAPQDPILAQDCRGIQRRVQISTERLVLDDFFKVKKASLRFEKFDGNLGNEITQLAFIRGHAVAILLYDEAAHAFIFIEQFRYPYFDSKRTHGWMIETVAGMVDKNESPLAAAQRETIEEIGFACEDVQLLAEFYVSPGSSAEQISVYWGKLGKKISEGGGKASENENIRLVRMPVAEAYEKLERGEFQDAKTIIALLRAKPLLTRV